MAADVSPMPMAAIPSGTAQGHFGALGLLWFVLDVVHLFLHAHERALTYVLAVVEVG